MSDAWDDRKKALEEDYFRRKEREALEKMREQMSGGDAAAEGGGDAAAGAAAQCPRGDGALETITVEGVEVDRCGTCGGVWLDAGELEQLTRREGGGGWFSRLWGGGQE